MLDYGVFGQLIKRCTDYRLIRQGRQIHARLVLLSVAPDNYLGSKLLTFYSKTGYLREASKVFDEIRHKNVFAWNAMFIACSLHSRHVETLKLFKCLVDSSSGEEMVTPDNFTITCVLKSMSSVSPDPILGREIHGFVLRHGFESDIFVVNALLSFYARSDDFNSARSVFDRMPLRDIVSWNSMISGFARSGYYEECVMLYKQMERLSGLRPNEVTVIGVLQACTQLKDLVLGMEVHRFVIDNKIEMDLSVCNSIMGMYSRCGSLDYARELFEEMSEKDEITYGSMISGYMVHGFVDEAIDLFRTMKNPALTTWNSVISGLIQNNRHEGVSELVREMQAMGFRPNSVTLSSILPTFAYFSNLKGGKQIHGYAIRNNFDQNIYVATAIIDVYAKAGFLRGAHEIFMQLRSRNLIIWTAIIAAFAAHGDADSAISLFNEMIFWGIRPDPVTFTAVLAACAHAGLVDAAQEIFQNMLPKYGIQPSVEQYACMVGVLSRAGMLSEAVDFILKMPVEPSAKVWGSLLNGAWIFGDVELGRFVCDQLFEIEPENTGNYIILANLYSRAGRWEEADKVREKMKKVGLKKIPGCSWVDTSSGSQNFTTGDTSNKRMEEIYGILEGLIGLMKEEGYVSSEELDEQTVSC